MFHTSTCYIPSPPVVSRFPNFSPPPPPPPQPAPALTPFWGVYPPQHRPLPRIKISSIGCPPTTWRHSIPLPAETVTARPRPSASDPSAAHSVHKAKVLVSPCPSAGARNRNPAGADLSAITGFQPREWEYSIPRALWGIAGGIVNNAPAGTVACSVQWGESVRHLSRRSS